MSQQKKNDYKVMQWFGFIIVVLSLVIDVNIIRHENGPGPVFGFSYLALIGIIIGATITFYYNLRAKKTKK